MAAKKDVEYRFLLMGKSGNGKSSTANSIMGEKLFPTGTGFESCTKTCEFRKSSKAMKGVTTWIVDTPGLFDPEKSNEEIKEEIIKAAAAVSPGLHAILYVIKPDRYTEEERNCFSHLKELLGHDVVKYVIIIVTKGDELKKKKITLDKLLDESHGPLKEVVQECGRRVLVFNNTSPDSKQRKELMAMVDKIWKENGEQSYSCPIQDHVNVKLDETVAIKTQERIEKDPDLKTLFESMAESIRKAQKEVSEKEKVEEETVYNKEMTEQRLAETITKTEEKEQMEKESQEEERKQEEKRERKQLEKEAEDLKKELEKLQREQELAEKMKQEKKNIKEKYEKKLEDEKEKLEKEVKEKEKVAIVEGKEKHWTQSLVEGTAGALGGAWTIARGWLQI